MTAPSAGTTSTNGSSVPTSAPPGGTNAPAEWRAGDNAPAWARGKSAEEILGIANSLVDALPSAAAAAPAPAQSGAPAANGGSVDVADDDYINGATLKRILATRGQDTSSHEFMASTNVHILKQECRDDFDKYGPEISGLIANIPAHQRTLDNMRMVVRLVRGNHVDELARERAQQLVAEMAPTIRSGGAPAVGAPVSRDVSLESEKIPAEWKRRANAAGITESVVDEFCRANDMSPAAFYKQFEQPLNPIVQDIPNRRVG